MIGLATQLGILLTAPAWAEVTSCPPGMVLVGGSGKVGMRGQPYGIVPTAHLKTVVAPEAECPAAVRKTEGATACWVQTDLVDPVVPPRKVDVSPFCIDAFPFPGVGSTYSADGLNVWTAKKMRDVLGGGHFGRRRFCTATEFQAAVAGLESNRRFVYGDAYVPGRCKGETIGADPHCRNPETGTHEYAAIHSHWVVADKAFVDFACGSTGCNAAGNRQLKPGMLIVMGGTSRFQTRQAPLTPHTWHDHGEATPDACGFQGWDDQPAICADPGPINDEAEAKWTQFTNLVKQSQKTEFALSKWTGEEVCPKD